MKIVRATVPREMMMLFLKKLAKSYPAAPIAFL
jgi:hypothetical protein